MEPGKVVFEGKTAKGTQIIVRYPKADDLQALLNYINTLSTERTFVSFQGEQMTEEEEKKFLDELLFKISKNKAVQLLAFAGDKLVGVVGVEPKDKTQKHTAILGISVSRDLRHQGIGKLLMEKALGEVKNNLPNTKIITLNCFANNAAALKMYEKLGFKRFGLLPGGIIYKDELIDLVLMHKEIA